MRALSMWVMEALAPRRPREGVERALAAEATGIHHALLGLLFLAFGACLLWLLDPNDIVMVRGNPAPAGNLIALPLTLGAALLRYGLASARRARARYRACIGEQQRSERMTIPEMID